MWGDLPTRAAALSARSIDYVLVTGSHIAPAFKAQVDKSSDVIGELLTNGQPHFSTGARANDKDRLTFQHCQPSSQLQRTDRSGCALAASDHAPLSLLPEPVQPHKPATR